jgi:hypothetical protein
LTASQQPRTPSSPPATLNADNVSEIHRCFIWSICITSHSRCPRLHRHVPLPLHLWRGWDFCNNSACKNMPPDARSLQERSSHSSATMVSHKSRMEHSTATSRNERKSWSRTSRPPRRGADRLRQRKRQSQSFSQQRPKRSSQQQLSLREAAQPKEGKIEKYSEATSLFYAAF